MHYEFKNEYPDTISADKLAEWMDRERKFQRGLSVSDPRHWRMFKIDESHLLLYWGGYEYPFEMKRLKTPLALLDLIRHVGEKEWPHTTGQRISDLIEAVAKRKKWNVYGH